MKNKELKITMFIVVAIIAIINQGFCCHSYYDMFLIIIYFTYGLYCIEIYNFIINKFKL
jgi:hypothetical protein